MAQKRRLVRKHLIRGRTILVKNYDGWHCITSCICCWLLCWQEKGRKKVFALTWLSVFSLPATSPRWSTQVCKIIHASAFSHHCLVVVVRSKHNQHISAFAILRSRCRPLWQPVNDIRLQQVARRRCSSSQHCWRAQTLFPFSVGHCQLWANSKARSMLSVLCAVGSWLESFLSCSMTK